MTNPTIRETEVQECMTRSPATVGPEDSVKVMMETMQREGISALPVVNALEACVGIVSLGCYYPTGIC